MKNHIPAKGVQGIFGFEQLDRRGWTNWQIVLLTMLTSTVASVAMYPILAHIPLPDGYPDNLYKALGIMFCYFISFYIFITIALSRAMEADLNQLSDYYPQVEDYIRQMHVNPRYLVIACICGVAAYFAIMIFADVYAISSDLSATMKNIFAQGVAGAFFWLALIPITGIFLGPMLVTIINQPIVLTRFAANVPIDLLSLDRYECISNSLLRFIFAFSVGTSLVFSIGVFVQSDKVESAFMAVTLVITASGLVASGAYFYPVLKLRTRIKEEKCRALLAIRLNIDANRNVNDVNADLLTRQMFIESRWEWPIAGHVQKIAIFGFLPPISWAMAATIEQILY